MVWFKGLIKKHMYYITYLFINILITAFEHNLAMKSVYNLLYAFKCIFLIKDMQAAANSQRGPWHKMVKNSWHRWLGAGEINWAIGPEREGNNTESQQSKACEQ